MGGSLNLRRLKFKAVRECYTTVKESFRSTESRYLRHLISGIRVTGQDDRGWRVEANYVVFETPLNELSRVFNVGRYLDRIVRDGDALKFAEKLCVFDSLLVPNSIIYPI
jgi:salicylate 5-hydroxylase small subunit